MGKSQATIFFIIGILLVLLVSFFVFKPKIENKVADSAEKSLFNAQIDSCIEQTIIEGEKLYGLHKQKTPPLISAYVTKALPLCIDFKSYEQKGFTINQQNPNVNIKITNDALIADVYYPISLTKDNLKFSFEKSTYTYPRTVMEKLNKNSDTIVVSADGKLRLEIPAGTEATLDGKPVNAVGIKQLDRNFNGMSNSVLMGMTAYNGVPHGAVFSQPIKIYYYYEDWEIPPFIKEEDIKIGYFPDDLNIWIGLPTKVDPVNNVLVVETKHFSIYGSVVKCGSENVLNQIITPVLIREGCRDCNEWNFVEDYNPDYPIFPGQLYKQADLVKIKEGTKELDDVEFLSGSCTVNEITTTAKKGTSEISDNFFFKSGSTCMDFSKECAEINENKDKCGVQKCVCDEQNKRYEFLDFETSPSRATLVNSFDSSKITLENGEKSTINGKDFDLNKLKNFLGLLNQLSPNKKFVSSTNDNLQGTCGVDNKGNIIKLENVRYDNNYLYFCGLESCAYDSYEDLKARQVYEVHFKGLGDSCIAEAEEKTTPGMVVIDVAGGYSNAESNPEKTITVTYDLLKTTTAIEETTPPNKKLPQPYVTGIDSITGKATASESNEINHPLSIDITPICYEDDDCEILNAHFKEFKPNDKCQNNLNNNDCSYDIILEFTIESTNGFKNDKPDACLMGAAQILFKGTGIKSDYETLCNKDTLGIYDFIDGKCMICREEKEGTNTKYVWKEETSENCLYVNCGDGKCCAPSLIGKKINIKGNCKECQISEKFMQPGGLGLGIWQDSQDCDQCGTLEQSEKTESQNE